MWKLIQRCEVETVAAWCSSPRSMPAKNFLKRQEIASFLTTPLTHPPNGKKNSSSSGPSKFLRWVSGSFLQEFTLCHLIWWACGCRAGFHFQICSLRLHTYIGSDFCGLRLRSGQMRQRSKLLAIPSLIVARFSLYSLLPSQVRSIDLALVPFGCTWSCADLAKKINGSFFFPHLSDSWQDLLCLPIP